jgi:Uma2 family endonuclease
MAMPALLPRYSLEDLARFPDDGNRYELVAGHLLVTPKPAPPHELVVWRLSSALTAWALQLGGVMVLLSGTVEVAPNTHLEPDLLVLPEFDVLPETWTAISGQWLAVEVSGRGSRVYDRDYKRPAYLAAGIAECWRADLRDRCVYVSTVTSPEERAERDTLVFTPPIGGPSLHIPVPPLFEQITELS